MAAAPARAAAAPSPPISRNGCGAARTGCGGFCRAGSAPAPGSPSSLVAIVVVWLASGFYRVQPDEVGIVLRFGAYDRTTQPGLNYHLPSPIEKALTPSVTRVNRTEIGYRSGETQTTREPVTSQVPEEALMLTGDENIVDINFTVFWVIKDAKAYLFNIRDPELTVKSAAESAMREVIGETPIAQALGRRARQDRDAIPRRCCRRSSTAMAPGSRSPRCSCRRSTRRPRSSTRSATCRRALADRARLRNEAESYRNDIIPRARGDAVRIEQEAEAYRQAIDRSLAGRRRPLPLGLHSLQGGAGRHPRSGSTSRRWRRC